MPSIAEIKKQAYGFVGPDEIAAIADENRFEMLLVRCGGGRFIAPAQDINHFVELINASGTDYVRDVSFPARSY